MSSLSQSCVVDPVAWVLQVSPGAVACTPSTTQLLSMNLGPLVERPLQSALPSSQSLAAWRPSRMLQSSYNDLRRRMPIAWKFCFFLLLKKILFLICIDSTVYVCFYIYVLYLDFLLWGGGIVMSLNYDFEGHVLKV